MARITPIDVIKSFSWVTPVISLICCNSTFVNQIVRMQWEMPPKFFPSSSQVSPIFYRQGWGRREDATERTEKNAQHGYVIFDRKFCMIVHSYLCRLSSLADANLNKRLGLKSELLF